MNGRTPGAEAMSSERPHRPVGDRARERNASGLLYALLIGAVLLIATALYAVSLHQNAAHWREAAEQLALGRDLLRADRDEILRKVIESEGALSTLEAAQEQDRSRLQALEAQRQRLQAEVLRLTEALARRETEANGPSTGGGPSAAADRLEQERARLDRELDARSADLSRLESLLDEKERTLARRTDTFEMQLQAASAEISAQQLRIEQLERDLAERRRNERLRQVVRGHRASLGGLKPYIAEIGPEDWSLIEGWLEGQLRRPMTLPDLSDRGWSYEGARLLGVEEGPPMAMLLYADDEGRPVSLTIASDRKGEQPPTMHESGRLRLIEWRENDHAFILAGEADQQTLEAVANDLQRRPPGIDGDAAVPESRYVRPEFRPET